jgi:hypothetical protein
VRDARAFVEATTGRTFGEDDDTEIMKDFYRLKANG